MAQNIWTTSSFSALRYNPKDCVALLIFKKVFKKRIEKAYNVERGGSESLDRFSMLCIALQSNRAYCFGNLKAISQESL